MGGGGGGGGGVRGVHNTDDNKHNNNNNVYIYQPSITICIGTITHCLNHSLQE